jgi:hypothetical protein
MLLKEIFWMLVSSFLIIFVYLFSLAKLLCDIQDYLHYNIFDFPQQQKTVAKSAKTVAQAFKQRFSRRGIYGRCLFK